MPKSLPDALDLLKPELLEAEGKSDVDSLKLLDGGTVRVIYDDMRASDLITLNWPIEGSPYPPLEPQEGVDGGYIDFHIPAHYIALWLDDYAIFTYTVSRNDEEQTSRQGSVRISLPSNLPQVELPEAIDSKLDLSLLCCKDPTILISPWAFAGTNQTINCYLSGTYLDGTKARLYPFKHEPVTEEDVRTGWRRPLPRDVLLQLKHHSELHILCEVRFRQSAGAVYRLFRPLLLTLHTEPHLQLSPPEMREAVHTEFDGCVLNPVNTVKGAHVVVAYERVCSDDRVCLTLSGTPGPGSPSLECREVGEGESSVVFAVPPSAISANFKKTITLAYNVRRCDGSQWFSPNRTVKVLGIDGLSRPNIEQATGNVLDLYTFDDDATGVVPIWDYAALGQSCWMWWVGVLEDGSPYRFDILINEPLTSSWLEHGVDAAIPRAELQKLADCSDLRLYFAVSFNGLGELGTAVEFPFTTFHLEQEPLVLLEPSVTEAVGTDLTAWNGRNGVHVEVDYVGNNTKHSISVFWQKSDDTCWPLASKPGSPEGAVIFALPPEAVIESMGKTVKINYTVTTACKRQTSLPLNLSISVPVHLETPNVLEATPPNTQNAALDLRTFIGAANSLVDPMWFLRAEQKCWLRVDGTDKNGIAYWFNVYAGRTITTAEETAGVASPVLRSELDKLKNDTNLTLTFSVATDGSSTGNVVCPQRMLVVRTPPLYDFTSFAGNNRNGWLDGGASQGENRYAVYFSKPCIANGTGTSGTAGVILYKDFTGLDVGRSYRFSMLGCTYNGAAPYPELSLRTNAGAVTALTTFSAMAWRKIEGTFIASSSSMQLQVVSHVASGAGGNDFAMTDLLVEDL
ncbi:hypothetical protein [Pseudomonas pergaminensis]|uniref:hypothetical protein n=1 Tax=Pseudomonas pergaminensis TaxID=2853159 RepID=UPI0034D7133D